jgi:hypothetical protein
MGVALAVALAVTLAGAGAGELDALRRKADKHGLGMVLSTYGAGPSSSSSGPWAATKALLTVLAECL